MTLPVEVVAEIRRLHYAEHWKRGTICQQLGVHPDAVERALTRHGPQPRQPAAQTLLTPYLGFVDETLRQYPRLVATRLDEMLRERGYAGSLRTLRRHLVTARGSGCSITRKPLSPSDMATWPDSMINYSLSLPRCTCSLGSVESENPMKRGRWKG